MSYHKELLVEIVQEWGVEQLNQYLVDLRERREQLDAWIKQVQTMRAKLMKDRTTPENGARDGR